MKHFLLTDKAVNHLANNNLALSRGCTFALHVHRIGDTVVIPTTAFRTRPSLLESVVANILFGVVLWYTFPSRVIGYPAYNILPQVWVLSM